MTFSVYPRQLCSSHIWGITVLLTFSPHVGYAQQILSLFISCAFLVALTDGDLSVKRQSLAEARGPVNFMCVTLNAVIAYYVCYEVYTIHGPNYNSGVVMCGA